MTFSHYVINSPIIWHQIRKKREYFYRVSKNIKKRNYTGSKVQTAAVGVRTILLQGRKECNPQRTQHEKLNSRNFELEMYSFTLNNYEIKDQLLTNED